MNSPVLRIQSTDERNESLNARSEILDCQCGVGISDRKRSWTADEYDDSRTHCSVVFAPSDPRSGSIVCRQFCSSTDSSCTFSRTSGSLSGSRHFREFSTELTVQIRPIIRQRCVIATNPGALGRADGNRTSESWSLIPRGQPRWRDSNLSITYRHHHSWQRLRTSIIGRPIRFGERWVVS